MCDKINKNQITNHKPLYRAKVKSSLIEADYVAEDTDFNNKDDLDMVTNRTNPNKQFDLCQLKEKEF